jgi:hypothetical protein
VKILLANSEPSTHGHLDISLRRSIWLLSDIDQAAPIKLTEDQAPPRRRNLALIEPGCDGQVGNNSTLNRISEHIK